MKFSPFVLGVCAVAALGSPLPLRAAPPAPETAAAPASTLEQDFLNPPRSARPWAFWMWLGVEAPPEALTRDLEEMHAKGIVGTILYGGSLGPIWHGESKVVLEGKEYRKVPTDDYKGSHSDSVAGKRLVPWSDPWRAAVRFAAKEAGRIGVDFCLSQGPTALREFVGDEYGQQALTWSEDHFKGPGVYDRTLPLPDIKRGSKEKAPSGQPYHLDIAVQAIPVKPVVQTGDIVDLTAKMDAAGHLRWDAPPGEWTIIRFTQTATRKGNNFTLFTDGMSTEALDKSWASTIGRLLKEMTPEERKGLKGIEEDSWEAGEPTWTKKFAAEFQKRRGYDLLPYLPVLAGKTVRDTATGERVKRDYQLTISDLIADYHYAYKGKLIDQAGLTFYCEAAGPNLKESDLLKNSSKVDVAMAEFWMPSAHRATFEKRFLIRDAATANHVYGKPLTPCEAFTSVGPHWEESPFDMKATADQAFCDGTNAIVFHNFAQSPSLTAKPGYTFWAGTHYEPGVTWWNQSPALNTYLSRCSLLLRQGRFAADVLFYEGDQSGFLTALKTTTPTLGEGYDYDQCNTDALLSRVNAKGGRIVLPDGMNYRVLVLPENQPMSLAALEKIAALIDNGVPVVGPRPTGLSGLPLRAGDEAKFNALVTRLWTAGSRQISTKTARETLQAAGVSPDFEQHGLSAQGTMDWIHRTGDDGTEIYYVTSRWEHPETVDCTFRVAGRLPELWDPVTGETRPAVAFRQEKGNTVVPLQLGPCGSVFVVFRQPLAKDARGAASTNDPATTLQATLAGPWNVSFDPKWGGPAQVTFDALTDWTKRAEPGIKFYSGTAVYRKKFDLPAASNSGRDLVLDLGDVREVASVRLNGRDLGVVWTKPARVRIGEVVKPTANELEITIVNLWPNRLIGDASLPPAQRVTETNMRKFVPTTPLLPSGLLGPVTVIAKEKDPSLADNGHR